MEAVTPPHSVEIDAFPLPVLIVDADGTVEAANTGADDMFATTVAGSRLAPLFPDEQDVHGVLLDAAENKPGVRVPMHAERANGTPFTANAIASFTPEGKLLFTLRELHGNELIEASAHMFHAAFDDAPIGMAMFNTDGEYVRVNDALCRMLGREREQLIGNRDQELTHPEDRQSDLDAAWRILRGELDHWQTEKRFVRPDGEVVWVIANLTFIRDDRGRPLSWLGQFQDISDRKRAEQSLRAIADQDDLTGIPNRRRLIRELATRLAHAGRYGETGAVLVLDLDGFKEINDSFGHGAGDGILIDVALGLSWRLRGTDMLGRLGGDEFAVLLPHASACEAARVGKDLVRAVHEACRGAVTASCGIALYGPDRAGSPGQLLAEADQAMYRAKHAGRNRVAAGFGPVTEVAVAG